MDGEGRLADATGSVYDGHWHEGLRDGRGVLVSAAGDRYEGEWLADKRHGRGAAAGIDGRAYDGEWREGLFHGNGTYTAADGVYVGAFVEGKRRGRGKMTYADGDVYEGEWADDKYDGEGTHVYANGSTYTGGHKAGRPARTAAARGGGRTGARTAGEWRWAARHGDGVMTFASGTRYEGFFVEGKMEGEGRFVCHTGRTRAGSATASTAAAGCATRTATRYEGEWADDKRHATARSLRERRVDEGEGEAHPCASRSVRAHRALTVRIRGK